VRRRRGLREVPSIARLHPALGLADGLFRSLDRHAPRRSPISIAKTYIKTSFRFEGPWLLGCDDLRILQAVAALATTPRRKRIDPGPDARLSRLRDGLQLDGPAAEQPVLCVLSNASELRRIAGYGVRRRDEDGQAGTARTDGGVQTRLVMASLDRLQELAIQQVADDGRVSRYRMLAWDAEGTGWGRFRIALNPSWGSCALAVPPFTTVDLASARRLHGDPARLLHHRLSTMLGTGKEAPFRRERLAAYVWGEGDVAADVRAHRHTLLARAVEEDLPMAGWVCSRRANGTYDIKRPRLLT
jgi:hypothetical protein